MGDKYYWKKVLTDEELLQEAEKIENELFELDNNFQTDEEDDNDEADEYRLSPRITVETNVENESVQEENADVEVMENENDNDEASLSEKNKKIVINRKWKKLDLQTTEKEYLFSESVVEELFEGCSTPTDVFLVFLEPVIENIIFQSNLYAVQRGKNLNLTKEEFFVFLGINQLMGYHRLPSWKHYWSNSKDLGVEYVSFAMARDRFDTILSNLHINDNATIPNNNKDKLYKVKPLIQQLNDSFENFYKGTREVSVDESMIIFKGRSTLKQYNPMKPIKRGYKLWCMADQRGYILKFDVYQGKNDKTDERFEQFGLGEKVVLTLTEKEWGKNRKVYFDNFFNSLPLLEKLKAEKVLACGTIRSNRKGLPILTDKKMQRGDYDYRFSNSDIGVYKWMDSKPVLLASNFHGNEEGIVNRKQKDGSSIEIKCPIVVKDYNQNMGGVDHADQLRTSYGLSRRSKKWWHRLFWGMMDILFVNSFIVYCQLFPKIPLLDYRRALVQGLMVSGQQKLKTRKSNTSNNGPLNKRRKQNYSVSNDARLSNKGCHWVKFIETRGRCEVCSNDGIQSRPHSICSSCKVFLCCNSNKNCFVKFHQIDF